VIGWLEAIVVAQAAAFGLLLVRLQGGRRRLPPVRRFRDGEADTTVTVVVPTLNEGRRIGHCLAGSASAGERR
jgi:hypothetical protein